MLGAQIGNILITSARNGAANLAAPVRIGVIKASASFAAGLFFLAAIGCVTCAIWIYAIPYWGEPSAALIAGGFLFLMGMTVLGIGSLVLKRSVRPVVTQQTDQLPLIMNQIFREQKGAFLLAALIAGVVASENQRKR
jgi:hypothetical protein